MNLRAAGKLVVGFALCLVVFATTVEAAPSLAPADARSLIAGLKAVEDGKFIEARSIARKIKNPLARKILAWARFTTPDPNVGFEEIAAFMAANPDWPNQTSLQRRAEEAMSRDTPDEAILAWFRARPPLTGYGKARLGEALLFKGRRDEGRAMVRDAWVHGNFTKVRENALYKRHRGLLTGEDHRKRLDRLQWEGRYWPAKRMLWKVSADYRALGLARMYLRHNRGNVDTAIAKVPGALKSDPGLQYERLRWRNRKGKYAAAREILNNPPGDLGQPVRWWAVRSSVARSTLREGLISEAYRLAQNHGLKPDGNGAAAAFAEAEWLSGWIAFRFLDDAGLAQAHFERMYNAVQYPVSRARGAYWMARTLKAQGKTEAARTWHGIAAQHPTTYYGQLSIAHLHPGDGLELAPERIPSDRDFKAFNGHELERAVRMLAEVEADDLLRPFILGLDEVNDASGWRQLTIELAQAAGRPDLSLLIAKREGRENLKFTEAAFPAIIPPKMHARAGAAAPETPLVLAIVRQESAFHISARSRVSAQGLMQLMPYTASRVAKQLQIPFSKNRLTTDAAYNLTLGQAYLGDLLKTFNGSYVLALAAYNAGPKRAQQWLRRFGDLREADVDSIDWVESIPFSETRNYVQRVLENLQVYRHRLADTEVALRLEDDLHQ
ncbi:MAG: lytic transglycosylase domain-containing protein [Rhodospirillales bacterium]|nr:lytic transglycosylase domain-containing protein [Rhodospirillales bacterium]